LLLRLRKYVDENRSLPEKELIDYAESQKDKGAHYIDCGNPQVPPERGTWNGHLVLIVDGILVDFTVGQVTRAEKGIIAYSTALPILNHDCVNKEGEMIASLAAQNGSQLAWFARPGNMGYQCSPQFNSANRAKTANKIYNKVVNHIKHT